MEDYTYYEDVIPGGFTEVTRRSASLKMAGTPASSVGSTPVFGLAPWFGSGNNGSVGLAPSLNQRQNGFIGLAPHLNQADSGPVGLIPTLPTPVPPSPTLPTPVPPSLPVLPSPVLPAPAPAVPKWNLNNPVLPQVRAQPAIPVSPNPIPNIPPPILEDPGIMFNGPQSLTPGGFPTAPGSGNFPAAVGPEGFFPAGAVADPFQTVQPQFYTNAVTRPQMDWNELNLGGGPVWRGDGYCDPCTGQIINRRQQFPLKYRMGSRRCRRNKCC